MMNFMVNKGTKPYNSTQTQLKCAVYAITHTSELLSSKLPKPQGIYQRVLIQNAPCQAFLDLGFLKGSQQWNEIHIRYKQIEIIHTDIDSPHPSVKHNKLLTMLLRKF